MLFRSATNNRVGIGTSSPSYKLHVATGSLTLNGADNSVATLRSGASTYLNIFQSYTSTFLGTKIVSTDALAFGTSSTDRMFLDSSGYLGIGVTPSYKLDLLSALSGAKMFRFSSAGTSKYMYGYCDVGGTGITNSDPYKIGRAHV